MAATEKGFPIQMSISKACATRLQKEYKAIIRVRAGFARVGSSPSSTALHSEKTTLPAKPTTTISFLTWLFVHSQDPVPCIEAHPSPSSLLVSVGAGTKCVGNASACRDHNLTIAAQAVIPDNRFLYTLAL